MELGIHFKYSSLFPRVVTFDPGLDVSRSAITVQSNRLQSTAVNRNRGRSLSKTIFQDLVEFILWIRTHVKHLHIITFRVLFSFWSSCWTASLNINWVLSLWFFERAKLLRVEKREHSLTTLVLLNFWDITPSVSSSGRVINQNAVLKQLIN